MLRFVFVLLIASTIGVSARRASADATVTTPGGESLNATMLKIWYPDDNEYKIPTSDHDRWHYFNYAHCQCAHANPGDELSKFEYLLTLSATTNTSKPLEIFKGDACDSVPPVSANSTCVSIPGSISSIDSLIPSGSELVVNVYDAVNYNKTYEGQECAQREGAGHVWAVSDTNGNTASFDTGLDIQVAQDTASTVNGIDTEAPEPIAGLKALYSESSIVLSWSAPTSRQSDIYEYEYLCVEQETGMPAFTTASNDADYDQPSDLCGLDNDVTLEISSKYPATSGTTGTTVDAAPDAEERLAPEAGSDAAGSDAAGSDAGGSDAGADAGQTMTPDAPSGIPADFFRADKKYICGQDISNAATGTTIHHLKNNVPYYVAVLVMDIRGNFRGVYYPDPVTPMIVDDFWENIHTANGKAEGGFCLLNSTYGDDSWLTNTLRDFRDQNLGSDGALTRIYYATLGKLGFIADAWIGLRILCAVLLLPLVAVALLWHFLTLPGLLALIALLWILRRRALTGRRFGPAIAAAATVLVLAPAAARADNFIPDWQKEASTSREDTSQPEYNDGRPVKVEDSTPANWHAGIRVGPYTPAIDKQVGGGQTPYHDMFGGYNIVPMLDVDRFLWNNDYFQVGIGASIGYLTKTAHPYKDDGGVPDRDSKNGRVEGATNSFRLIPAAITASFRFTYLDEAYGIPIVPYVKGGVAYDAWWVSAPQGGYARVCKDGMRTDQEACDTFNTARGASAGLTGAIGINIRAERIDAVAVRSMRASGIQHAGFYAEYGFAWVDGFGSSKKLSVGDNTWWAGVDFEF